MQSLFLFRDNIKLSLWIKSTDVLNSNFIAIMTLHVSGILSAHHQEFLAVHRLWYILCSCDDPKLPGAGWNWIYSVVNVIDRSVRSIPLTTKYIQFHPAPGNKRSSQLYRMYHNRYTSKNSWWWAESCPKHVQS